MNAIEIKGIEKTYKLYKNNKDLLLEFSPGKNDVSTIKHLITLALM